MGNGPTIRGSCLRPLRQSDLDDLLVVQESGAVVSLANVFPQEKHPFPAEQIRARWAHELTDPGIDCFAIVEGGRLAGFAATRENELLHFGTAIQTWGSGLARCAHDDVLNHVRAQGYSCAWLRVFDENLRAVRFYTLRGWTPTTVTTRTSYPPHPILRRFEIDLPDAGT